MSKTKKEVFDDLLTALMQVGQLKASGIVSREGLLINSISPPDINDRLFFPLCSTIMNAAKAASIQINTGSISEISLKTEKGSILLVPAGPKAILTALTETEAQIVLILFEMESIAEQVEHLLSK
jgi:uncharacterized protein